MDNDNKNIIILEDELNKKDNGGEDISNSEIGFDEEAEKIKHNLPLDQDEFTIEEFKMYLPKEKVPNMFIVLETNVNGEENPVASYESEIEAYKFYNEIPHKRKRIINATAIYSIAFGERILADYE